MYKTHLFTRRAALAVIMSMVTPLGMPLMAATTATGLNLQSVRAVRETVASSSSSTAFVNIAGATATITLPANQKNLLIVRFSAESACYGTTGWCAVRILANGVEMDPIVGSDFAFDSSNTNLETSGSWESHAMERSKAYASTTSAVGVTITVQRLVTSASLTFRLDDWHLTVEQFRA